MSTKKPKNRGSKRPIYLPPGNSHMHQHTSTDNVRPLPACCSPTLLCRNSSSNRCHPWPRSNRISKYQDIEISGYHSTIFLGYDVDIFRHSQCGHSSRLSPRQNGHKTATHSQSFTTNTVSVTCIICISGEKEDNLFRCRTLFTKHGRVAD